MNHSPIEIFNNVWILCGIASWGVAQLCKLMSGFIQTRDVDFAYLVSTGGMPSAHSASMSGLATGIGITHGFASPLFAIAFALAVVTMFDASTIRLAAGKQAQILNEIVRTIRTEHRMPAKPLKELLGHTRFEVFMGMIIGIMTAVNIMARLR